MINYFEHFASKGHHPSKEDILKLEETLTFQEINDDLVNQLFQEAMGLLNKPIGLRLTYNGHLYKQYLMENIKEDWLLRKEKVTLETHHSSYYIFLDNIDNHQYDYMIHDESYGICGGSFPIIINHQCVGAYTCTGLRPHEDHQIIIDSIKSILERG
ncbi:MAG: heme-binding protein [Erysipelotrichaceae bacterium]|nr:heme-binding protein [Erysipelotrichaceae bacterium]